MSTELLKAERWAIAAGRCSPCQKSKRGVAVFNRSLDVYHIGWNAQPQGFSCTGSEACKAACGKICVHAEQVALIEALSVYSDLREFEILHVKVEEGVAVPSGGPSCVECSKLILFCNLRTMWLLEDRGSGPQFFGYTPVEFHRETLKNLGLHP